jgi:glycosyltransferase involved in cell wall biosynthesis
VSNLHRLKTLPLPFMTLLLAAKIRPEYLGGLASYQRTLGAHLESLDHDVRFLSEVPATGPGFSPAGEDLPHSMVLSVNGRNKVIDALFSRIASRPWLHPLWDLLVRLYYLPKLRRVLKGRRPVAVHCTGTGSEGFGFALAAFARSVGARFTVWPAVHPGSWGDHSIDLRLYKSADKVFCQSQFEAGHLVSKGLDQGKTILCGLPPMCRTDGSGLSLRQKLAVDDRPAVLFLGRRDEGKGYPALLRAWPLVLKEVPDAVLLLAGPGGSQDESLLRQLPSGSIRDLGKPDEKQKADAYAACDVFCLPSEHESFGIVYIEAWSYGKPVICGTAPASRELVQDGVTGIHADHSAAVLASALLRLLKNPEEARRMGAAGRALQQRRFSAEVMCATHIQTFLN